MRSETKSHGNQLTLRKSPTHVDPRQTRLDIELRFQYTVGFDKSHTGVYREILCHCHIGAQLDSGQVVTLRFAHGIFHELSSQSQTLVRRVYSDIVDEIGIDFGPRD